MGGSFTFFLSLKVKILRVSRFPIFRFSHMARSQEDDVKLTALGPTSLCKYVLKPPASGKTEKKF